MHYKVAIIRDSKHNLFDRLKPIAWLGIKIPIAQKGNKNAAFL